MRNNKVHIILSIVIIVCSLYYTLYDVSAIDIAKAIGSIHLIYVFPAIFMVAISYWFRAMRWRYIIASIKEVKTVNLLSPLMIGSMGNMLPARAGEFIRAYLLGKNECISFTTSFATIFIEKLVDLLFVLFLLLFVLFSMSDLLKQGDLGANSELMNYMITFGWISFTVCSFVFLFSVFLQYKRDLATKIIDICLNPFPNKFSEKAKQLANSFTDGLKIIKDKRRFSAVILLSFLISICIILSFYFLYLAFDINVLIPIFSSLLVLFLTVDIFVALFPTPGFFGSFHAACVAALNGIFGIPKAIALSYGIVAWLIIMGFTILLGTIYIIKDNISFHELKASREEIT